MRNEGFDIIRRVFAFRGYAELAVLDACERGVNSVYWSMMLFGLPPTLLTYLWFDYSPYGWVYVIVPIAYLPVALGWYPANQALRFYLAAFAMTLLALGVNARFDWGAQPGLYILIPPSLVIFIVHGARALCLLTLAQMTAVGGAAVTLGVAAGVTTVWGVVAALAVWGAMVFACTLVVHQILLSSRLRAAELETLSDRLLENEEVLRENSQSLRHIFRVSLEDISVEAEQLSGDLPADQRAVVAARLRQHLDDLRQRVLPNESE